MEQTFVTVSLNRAPEYYTKHSGYGGGSVAKTTDELVFTVNMDDVDPVHFAARQIAKLIQDQGVLVFGNDDLKQVLSFKQYVSAAVREGGVADNDRLPLNLSSLL